MFGIMFLGILSTQVLWGDLQTSQKILKILIAAFNDFKIFTAKLWGINWNADNLQINVIRFKTILLRFHLSIWIPEL